MLCALAVVGPGTAASAASTPVLVSASLDKTAVAVSGLNVAPVKVTVHLTDPDGICDACRVPSLDASPKAPAATLSAGFNLTVFAQLTLVSGTATDGVWSGTAPVTARFGGRHLQFIDLVVVDLNQNTFDIKPADQGINIGVDVTATHVPNVSVGFVPNPVPYLGTLTWKGRAYFTDTGAPIANRKLLIGNDVACGIDFFGETWVTTNSQGYWSYTQTKAQDFVRCVFLTPPTKTDYFSTPIFVLRQPRPIFIPLVSISLAQTSAPLGTIVTVTGNVIPSYASDTVSLQRQISGVWRTVGTAHIRASGRYTAYAQPASRGVWHYRAVVNPPAGSGFVEGISRTVTLTVT
jgi:hypothetical protein